LENEARKVWQKCPGNPRPINKGTICRVFYMRNETLYKKSEMEDQIKRM
jgi:hypothetical protein